MSLGNESSGGPSHLTQVQAMKEHPEWVLKGGGGQGAQEKNPPPPALTMPPTSTTCLMTFPSASLSLYMP